MSATMICGEGLGKRYRRGLVQSSGLLRESLGRALKSPLRSMRKQKQETFWALKDVSLEVREGEVLGLIGRNGAGKTTLLKILSRITQPTTGWAEIHGRVGSLLEVGTGFHPELTGRENTFLSGAILGMSKSEISRKFDEIVAFAELEQFIDTPVKHYSSGMYVRLAFAVAAHLEPEILLVDEVLAVGDIRFQKKCLGKMGDVARAGRTVVLVTHQMNQIRRLCHRAIWIDSGTVRQAGQTGEVVGAYELAMTSGERYPSEGAQNGHGKVRFLNWAIESGAADSPYTLASLGPVRVKFNVEVNEQMNHIHQGIALFNADRQLVWAFSADDISLEKGIVGISYEFPYLPIRPGPYSWQLSLWGDEGNVDMWDAFPELLIATENYQHARDEWNGFMNIPCQFSIQRQSESRH
jgi:lipopolysaccharide transport system ATP-binding protein